VVIELGAGRGEGIAGGQEHESYPKHASTRTSLRLGTDRLASIGQPLQDWAPASKLLLALWSISPDGSFLAN
jgi:hypothetical protein